MDDPTLEPTSSVVEIRKLPTKDRIPYLGQIRVIFPQWRTIYGAIGYCHEDARNSSSPEPECLLLVGPTGAGKSTLARSYAKQYPGGRVDKHVQRPVLLATVYPPATVKTLATNLLATLGDPRASSGTAGSMTQRLVDDFQDCRVELLMLDEIQHFFDRDNGKLLYTVSDWLKTLVKETRVACVLIGLQGRAEQIVVNNEQFAGLFGDPLILSPFSWDEPDPKYEKDPTEFQKLLLMLEHLLPFNEPSHLSQLDLAWRCYVASDGVLRYLMKLMRRASTLALKDGREKLDKTMLATAFSQSLNNMRRGIANPFEKEELPAYTKPPAPEVGIPWATSNRGQHPRPQQEGPKQIF